VKEPAVPQTMVNLQREAIEVRRIAGSLGAEISGVRLSGSLPQETIAAIKAAIHEHMVIFFRDQHHLDDAAHKAFADRFGPPFENPSLPDDVIAAAGGMFELDGAKPDGRAETWHTDSTFCHAPPAMAVLRGVTIPPYGGDTTWANCIGAYETLSAPLRALADQLWAHHSNKFDYAAMRPNASRADKTHFDRITTAKAVSSQHPLVHVHPVTGRRGLLVGKYAQRIVGHTQQESDRLKAIFQDHITRLANTVRWRWQQHDVAIWDNFATQHCVINDWGTQPRVVRRWTVAGQVPVGIDGRPGVAIETP
jgi:taurine dioxygenase